ncbi:MAG: hypothetical protein U0O22_07025 [Acutalibacteraceae bacterium]
MKKFITSVIAVAILSASAISLTACGCSRKETTDTNGLSDKPATDIVGEWGERSDDVTADFNDDGTCIIGGVQGTYEVDENNTLTVTPNSDGEQNTNSQVFEYYDSDNTINSVPADKWAVTDDTLYINGHQYNKDTASSSDSTSTNSNTGNSGNSTGNSSTNAQNSASNNTSSSTPSSATSSSTSNTNSSSSSNNNSSSTSQSDISSSSSGTGNIENEEEIENIVTNLDDFLDE